MRKSVPLHELFTVKSGDFHAIKELDPGRIPLVSCGDINHGLVGYFDVPKEKRYRDAITVAYNGQPLTAKFRPYIFGAKDDIGILKPHDEVGPRAMVYVATVLNARRWRYSYGRKCFKNKLETVEIEVPVIKTDDGSLRLDEIYIDGLLNKISLDMHPKLTVASLPATVPSMTWVEKRLDEIFELKRGDFHSLKPLATGDYATVSRTESDNGVVGYFERPDGSILYSPGLITVSTVSGDAFVQVESFIVTDNVIVCMPPEPMRTTSAFFIATMINQQKWRYSYGRQCYKEKLSALSIQVPWRDGGIDEDGIAEVVESQPYWPFVESRLTTSSEKMSEPKTPLKSL